MSEAARIDLVDRAPLSEKQQNVYESIMQYQRVNGYAPTIREICKMVENTIIIVTNDSMYDITVGDEYWISKLNGEQWEDMPTNIVWNDLGIKIRAGSYHEFNCNLNLFGNFDEDEKYRITKKCM